MKERHIIFSAPMVRAILDGRKSQTRRICRDQPHLDVGGNGTWWPDGKGTDTWTHGGAPGCYLDRCPYGQPGDRLWVREAWRSLDYLDNLSGSAMAEACLAAGYQRPWAPVEYIADGARVNWEHTGTPPHIGPPKSGRYRHARFMPRWASRITLEITGVRVERLQGISEADAIAEGIRELPLQNKEPGAWWCADPLGNSTLHFRTPRAAFASSWESINGSGSWADNPWVWVVDFREVKP